MLRVGSPPDPSIEAFRAALRDRAGPTQGGRDPGDPDAGGAAAKQATSVIPIVMTSADPVGSGLVDSLARPGRNITGLTFVLPELTASACSCSGKLPLTSPASRYF